MNTDGSQTSERLSVKGNTVKTLVTTETIKTLNPATFLPTKEGNH